MLSAPSGNGRGAFISAVLLSICCLVLYFLSMHIGPWYVQPYTARIVAGALIGLFWVAWRNSRQQVPLRDLPCLIWSVAIGALLMGRVGYVAANSAYFAQHPIDALLPWRVGGLNGVGAWAGGLVASYLWAHRHALSWRAVAALLAPAALLVAAGAWWGCAEVGCAWGQPALLPPAWLRWAVADAPDLYGAIVPRYAVQNIAALGSLAAALLIAVGLGRVSLWLPLYMVGMALLTSLRADPMLLLWGWRLDGWLYGALGLGIWLLWAGADKASPTL